MEMTPAALVCEDSLKSKDLFQGMKFFVVQRLASTSRSEIIRMIQTNGGFVVMNETQADILIADHEREDIPPQSISWTFIVESIKKGSRQDIEKHRAGSSTACIRDFNRQTGVKSRTSFSAADDQMLWEWCMNAKEKGMNLRGNSIYRQLEQKNNRHTYQSWRDRWIKYVSSRKPVKGNEPSGHSDQAYPDNDREKKTNFIGSRNPSSTRDVMPTFHSKTESTESTNSTLGFNNEDRTKLTKSNFFTEEERDSLRMVHPDILEVAEDQITNAWISWADEYPQHTAQQWQDYYENHVKPQQEALVSGKQRRILAKKDLHKVDVPVEQNESLVPISSSPDYNNSKQMSQTVPILQKKTMHGENEDTNDFSDDTASISEAQFLAYDPMLRNEELFRQGLRDLAYELDLEVNFNPVICGREISLMRLWQTVQSSKYGAFNGTSEDYLWQELAKKFGYDSSAALELKECYSEILSDFGNLRREFLMEGLPSESKEKENSENQLLSESGFIKNDQFKESEDSMSCDSQIVQHDSDDLDIPPVQEELHVVSRETSLDNDRSHANFIPNKRQRIKNGKRKVLEIPSTPENIINGYQDPDLAQKRSPKFIVICDETDEIEKLNQTPSNRRYSTRKSKLIPNSSYINIDSNNEPPSTLDTEPEPNLNPKFKTKTTVEDQDLLQYQKNPDDNKSSKFSSNIVKHKKTTDIVDEGVLTTQDNLSYEIIDNKHLINQGLKDAYNEQNLDSTFSEGKKKENFKICHDASCHPQKRMSTEENIAATDEVGEDNELDAFIREHVFNSGISQDIVIEALEATSLSIGPTSHIENVMDSLMNNEGIPDHFPGVWTASDDKVLKKAITQPSKLWIDSSSYQNLVKKHGLPNIKLRQMYWRDMEDDVEY